VARHRLLHQISDPQPGKKWPRHGVCASIVVALFLADAWSAGSSFSCAECAPIRKKTPWRAKPRCSIHLANSTARLPVRFHPLNRFFHVMVRSVNVTQRPLLQTLCEPVVLFPGDIFMRPVQ